MSTTSDIFTGASRFSSDFESVINRAVAIAALPLTQLQSQKANLEAQSNSVSGLESKFSALKTALDALQSSLNPGAFDLANSNGAVLGATAGTDVLEGAYSVNVTEIGAQSISVSSAALANITDPATQSITGVASLTLTVDGVATTITPSGANLNALAEAINEADAGVTATIVNLGTGASPDYRLSLQSTKFAPVVISLSDGSQLLTQVATGAKAVYQINGIPENIESDTRSVTVAPGLTVILLGEGSSTVTLTRSRQAVRNSLSGLVKAFNAAVDELDKHRGAAKGALAGQSLVFGLSDVLRGIANHEGSGGIDSLVKLGVAFDRDGHLTFDAAQFDTSAEDDYEGLAEFFGDAATSGFLKNAEDVLDGLLDDASGTLDSTITTLKDALKLQDSRIEDTQNRIALLQESLQAQFAAADSLIANLEQRVLYVQALFGAILNPPNSR